MYVLYMIINMCCEFSIRKALCDHFSFKVAIYIIKFSAELKLEFAKLYINRFD